MKVIRINKDMVEVGGIPCKSSVMIDKDTGSKAIAWFPMDNKAYTLQHSEALNRFICEEYEEQESQSER